MAISELRILPPFAIARFGSSENPLDAYELEPPGDDEPLGFRRIVPKKTLRVDKESGAIVEDTPPKYVRFRDGDKIRPVAPFLEVFARTSEDTLEPLTLDLLASEGLGEDAVYWAVEVANLKVFRQTGDEKDKVLASERKFNDHRIHALRGGCRNFLDDKCIPFGSVRYILPTPAFPQIRLRFTPAAGKVYGASITRFDWAQKKAVKDPVF